MNITEPTREQYARFGEYAAALLGSQTEWNGGDICEALAGAAQPILRISIGDQNADVLAFWRELADRFGIEYDDDDDSNFPFS